MKTKEVNLNNRMQLTKNKEAKIINSMLKILYKNVYIQRPYYYLVDKRMTEHTRFVEGHSKI